MTPEEEDRLRTRLEWCEGERVRLEMKAEAFENALKQTVRDAIAAVVREELSKLLGGKGGKS